MKDDRCPYCGSTDTEGDYVDTNGDNQATQEEFCQDCYAEWTNVYVLKFQNRTET